MGQKTVGLSEMDWDLPITAIPKVLQEWYMQQGLIEKGNRTGEY